MQMDAFRSFVRDFMPTLDREQRRIALRIYRGLADHGNVPLKTLGAQTRLSSDKVEQVVPFWPGVYRNPAGDVIGFWGLTAQPVSKHVLRIEGQARYAWCAWDCLFIPALLGRTVQVSSICPQTGEPIELTISPNIVERMCPDSTVLSLLIPDLDSCNRDVVSNFCHFVYFFKDQAAAEIWTAAHPGTLVVSVEQAMELGRIKNEWQFDAIDEVLDESCSAA